MALLTRQKILTTGLTPTYAAVSASDTFPNNGRTFLHVKNTDGSICTVTVDSTKNCDQGVDHDAVTTVPATTGDKMIGPFEVERYGSTPTVTFSNTTACTVSVLDLS